ncbi:MAG: hypothetical protein P4L84_33785, partial [Isosphaeraceae bacterium]|nr:hypothetical protein [Isosphaeraceae bacterium]
SQNPGFLSGETDLRGVFVAEGVRGEVTAVARKDAAEYAFYRGKTFVGARPNEPAARTPEAGKPAEQAAQALDANLKILNESNQFRQIERLQNRYQNTNQGGAAVQDFKGAPPAP